MSKRYRLVCVAPNFPSGGEYDDPDEAILAADAYHDVYDSVTDTYISPTCAEDVDHARLRLDAKRARREANR